MLPRVYTAMPSRRWRRKIVDVLALLESLQSDLGETGGTVTLEGQARAPYPGRVQALRRCIGNLLENAIKYGQRAHVVVDDSDAQLALHVRDEGPGIPAEEIDKVFEPFYRVEGSRNRDTGGTGLGLAIARGVAELHGGRITLKNRETGGLEATVVLPRTAEGRVTRPVRRRAAITSPARCG